MKTNAIILQRWITLPKGDIVAAYLHTLFVFHVSTVSFGVIHRAFQSIYTSTFHTHTKNELEKKNEVHNIILLLTDAFTIWLRFIH